MKKKLKEIIKDSIEFPKADDLTGMLSDMMYVYINSTYCAGFANMLENISAYMIVRYCLDESFECANSALLSDDIKCKPYFDNIKNLENISDKEWYHTKLGEFCDDDVIIVGESENHYYFVWFDHDVSDCSILKVSKEHYDNIDMFKEAVIEYFEINMNYKIKPIRKPNGWFNW